MLVTHKIEFRNKEVSAITAFDADESFLDHWAHLADPDPLFHIAGTPPPTDDANNISEGLTESQGYLGQGMYHSRPPTL